jgi:hypothetical protein
LKLDSKDQGNLGTEKRAGFSLREENLIRGDPGNGGTGIAGGRK